MKVRVNGFEYETDQVEIAFQNGLISKISEDYILTYEEGDNPSDGVVSDTAHLYQKED